MRELLSVKRAIALDKKLTCNLKKPLVRKKDLENEANRKKKSKTANASYEYLAA